MGARIGLRQGTLKPGGSRRVRWAVAEGSPLPRRAWTGPLSRQRREGSPLWFGGPEGPISRPEGKGPPFGWEGQKGLFRGFFQRVPPLPEPRFTWSARAPPKGLGGIRSWYLPHTRPAPLPIGQNHAKISHFRSVWWGVSSVFSCVFRCYSGLFLAISQLF